MAESVLSLQIVSDLHVEFWEKRSKFKFITPKAPFLLLLGDICCCGSADDFVLFQRFIDEVLPQFEHIIFVAGNHEYYYNPPEIKDPTAEHTISGIDKKISDYFKEKSPKLHFLNNKTLKLKVGTKTYLFIGATLWTWIPESRRKDVEEMMNDYQKIYVLDGKIRHLTAKDVVEMHATCAKFIRSQVTRCKKTKMIPIVLTHHKPYLSTDYDVSSADIAYESDLSDLFSDISYLWGYGHTHEADNSMQGKVWMYSNPKGYPYQKTMFKKAAIVKV